MTAPAALPVDLTLRFDQFVGWVKQAIVRRLERGGEREGLGPLGLTLWGYLGRTLMRLARLQARFKAGTLRPARARPARTRPTTPRAAEAAARHPLPRGPVLLRFHAAHLAPALAELIDDPEMQALLAAAPQAGRLLRPLWRRLSADRLPACLRLPARPRPPRTSTRSRPAPRPPQPRRRNPHRAPQWTPHWAPHGPARVTPSSG